MAAGLWMFATGSEGGSLRGSRGCRWLWRGHRRAPSLRRSAGSGPGGRSSAWPRAARGASPGPPRGPRKTPSGRGGYGERSSPRRRWGRVGLTRSASSRPRVRPRPLGSRFWFSPSRCIQTRSRWSSAAGTSFLCSSHQGGVGSKLAPIAIILRTCPPRCPRGVRAGVRRRVIAGAGASGVLSDLRRPIPKLLLAAGRGAGKGEEVGNRRRLPDEGDPPGRGRQRSPTRVPSRWPLAQLLRCAGGPI